MEQDGVSVIFVVQYIIFKINHTHICMMVSAILRVRLICPHMFEDGKVLIGKLNLIGYLNMIGYAIFSFFFTFGHNHV